MLGIAMIPVHGAHDDRVDRAEVARDNPDHQPEGHADQGRARPDDERDPRAVDYPGVDVAPEGICPERVQV